MLCPIIKTCYFHRQCKHSDLSEYCSLLHEQKTMSTAVLCPHSDKQFNCQFEGECNYKDGTMCTVKSQFDLDPTYKSDVCI